jgi:hypothetical protein
VSPEDAKKAILDASDAFTAAKVAFAAIMGFSDTEMSDGDTARDIAVSWFHQWVPEEIE